MTNRVQPITATTENADRRVSETHAQDEVGRKTHEGLSLTCRVKVRTLKTLPNGLVIASKSSSGKLGGRPLMYTFGGCGPEPGDAGGAPFGSSCSGLPRLHTQCLALPLSHSSPPTLLPRFPQLYSALPLARRRLRLRSHLPPFLMSLLPLPIPLPARRPTPHHLRPSAHTRPLSLLSLVLPRSLPPLLNFNRVCWTPPSTFMN